MQFGIEITFQNLADEIDITKPHTEIWINSRVLEKELRGTTQLSSCCVDPSFPAVVSARLWALLLSTHQQHQDRRP
jgi:hypothetical protein